MVNLQEPLPMPVAPSVDEHNPTRLHGQMLASGRISKYSLDQWWDGFEQLLVGDRWRRVEPGFENFNHFLGTLDLSAFNLDAVQRRPLVEKIKALQLNNRQPNNSVIGKVFGVSKHAIGRDLEAQKSRGATFSAGSESGYPSNKSRGATLSEPPGRVETKWFLTLRTHTGEEIQYPKPQSLSTFNETTGDGISWAHWSWNPVTGCLHGCEYCYAREIATSERFKQGFPVGFTPLFHHERLDAPANTRISAGHQDDTGWKRVFVCSMADLYGRWVPDEWITQVHHSMTANPQWDYMLLTKFPSRYVGLDLPESAWVGTSVDEQSRVAIAERAFREIRNVRVKWLSLEPLREPLKFSDLSMFDWVVIGAQTQTHQPDGVVEAFAPEFEWVADIIAKAKASGCRIHCKPNLLGVPNASHPGMKMPDEYPDAWWAL